MEKIVRKKKQSKRKLSKKFLLTILILTIVVCGVFLHKTDIVFNKKSITMKGAFQEDYSRNNAFKYSNFEIQGTSWLSFRDVPKLINKYVHGKKTLDFGCGAGRSTRFLKNIGLNVVGIDISNEFIKQAHRIDKSGKYILMKNTTVPIKNNTYDFVFSSHVLLMLPNKEELNKALSEMFRVTKKGGTCIIVTGSEKMHAFDEKWVSYKTNFPENINPKSGDMVKLFIKDCGAVFHDYNWTDEDYSKAIKQNGFEIVTRHYPLGKENEGYAWISEKRTSPYILYVLKKPEEKLAALN